MSSAAADTIVLKNGRRITAANVTDDGEHVSYETSAGRFSLPKSIVARIEKDNRPPISIYEPGNPDADERGMVAMPNINVHEEMADLISASRAFEANLAVVKNARSMALQTLAIGKH